MANRRMFSKEVVDTDLFLDMPGSARLLYYDMGMHADDDGFLQNVQKVVRSTGASRDDLRLLVAKGFVIPFDSGVVVIRHWRINNQIRADRHKNTQCTAEKADLTITSDGIYERLPVGCQTGNHLATQVRLGKYRLVEEAKLVKETRARTREALPAFAAPDDDENDLSDQIAAHQRADDLIRRYQLPDADPTREALLEDVTAVGWAKLEDALRQAALTNSRQRVSIVFYRSILYPTTTKGGKANAADPYAGYVTL